MMVPKSLCASVDVRIFMNVVKSCYYTYFTYFMETTSNHEAALSAAIGSSLAILII